MYNPKRVEYYLEKALKVLEENLCRDKKENKYKDMLMEDKEGQILIKQIYNGYVSALGPTLLQMGVLPTIAVYSADSNSEGNKKLILELLAQTCGQESVDELIDTYVAVSQKEESLEKIKLDMEIESAVVALKLAMRTFKTAPNKTAPKGE